MATKYTVELTEKEMCLIAYLLAWLRKPFTESLRGKFYKVKYPRRKELMDKYQPEIESQLISQGVWLKEYRERTKAT